MARRIAAGTLIALMSLAHGGCGGPGSGGGSVTIAGPTMGTRFRVRVEGAPPGLTRKTVAARVRGILEDIDRTMSTYRPDSEISRFNRIPPRDWLDVSPETVDVVLESLAVSRETHGAFDPTVAPLVDLWGFGPGKGTPRVPRAQEIAALLPRVGIEGIEARRAPPGLRKLRPGVELDLSGIAKGYAVDRVAEFLEALGAERFLIEIGGEVRTGESDPRGPGWRVGVERPTGLPTGVAETLLLHDASVATSGGYRNRFVAGGRSYSHLIDPRTGRPVEHPLASVTVVSERCSYADAMATALAVLGERDGFDLAQTLGLAALFLVRGEEGAVRIATAAFKRGGYDASAR